MGVLKSIAILLLSGWDAYAWVGRHSHLDSVRSCCGSRLLAVPEAAPNLGFEVIASAGDEESIVNAASLMIDAFWLGSPRQLVVPVDQFGVSPSVRAALFEVQAKDLQNKYGERIGKRLLNSCLLEAREVTNQKKLLGIVGLEMSLLRRSDQDILYPDVAESLVQSTIAALGPKQRRLFKDLTLAEIVDVLLPDFEAVCCLSNLAVSPNARRRGVAWFLCRKVEHIVQMWGYSRLYLKVESDNTAARELYERKLSYQMIRRIKDASGIRADPDAGIFVEVPAETLILVKDVL